MKGIEHGHVLWREKPQQQIIYVSFYQPILTACIMQHNVRCYVGNWALCVILTAIVVCVFEVSNFYLLTVISVLANLLDAFPLSEIETIALFQPH